MSSSGTDTTSLASCQNDRIVYPSGYIKSSGGSDGELSIDADANGVPLTSLKIVSNAIALEGALSYIKMKVFNGNQEIPDKFVYLVFNQDEGGISPSYLTEEEWNELNSQ